MSEVETVLNSEYSELITRISGMFATSHDGIFGVASLAILIALVSIFIWQFYKSTSKRNIIDMNLGQFNNEGNPIGEKVLAILFYTIEYILIMPFILLLWFGALSIILLIISERSPDQVMLISAALIGATRILAYHRKEISKDLAKLFPFIALSTFLLAPNAFNMEEVVLRLMEVPILIGNIYYFIIVIFVIEIVLRLFYTLFEFWQSEDERVEGDKEEEEESEEE